MSGASHPLLDRLLRRVGASADAAPRPEAWRDLLDLVARTYRDADQDRYTIERAMEVSSAELQDLYGQLRSRTEQEVAALRQANDRHRLLFDSNPVPMWILDAETLRFLDVNHAMVRTYGYTHDEFLSMVAMDVKLTEDVPVMLEAIAGAPLGEVHHLGPRRHRRKDGAILQMDLTVHALLIQGRRVLLAIAVDMTHASRVEEELRQAQKMEAIGRLAGGVAHDFNNLLSVILSNAEFALEDVADIEASTSAVGEIREAALRAAGLTRQLLMFSRRQARQARPLALNAVVTNLGSMLARIVGEDIEITTWLAPDLGTIEADAGEVEQIVMNLAVNARDAMPGGGRLTLATANTVLDDEVSPEIGAAAGPYVTLTVTDTGCGMSEEVQARIFEPFFTTKDVDRGTGLGLSTVFGIARQGNGAVTVDSSPGRGSTLRVYWPRIDADAVSTIAPSSAPVRGSGVILVVEDDAQLRNIIRRYVASWGYTPLEAANADAAVRLASEHRGPIDLLLTDLVMPGLDGHALSRQILAARPTTKVVYMSGYTEHAALRTVALARTDLFVQKPFTAQALSATLRRALRPSSPPPARARDTDAPDS